MLLELDHISKIYGDLRAVDDLNLTVPEGEEWLAIVGSSGSGKTTLMNMIGCMDTPSKGSVKLEGRKLEGPERHAAGRRAQEPHRTGVPEVLSGSAPDRRGKRDGGPVLPFGGR